MSSPIIFLCLWRLPTSMVFSYILNRLLAIILPYFFNQFTGKHLFTSTGSFLLEWCSVICVLATPSYSTNVFKSSKITVLEHMTFQNLPVCSHDIYHLQSHTDNLLLMCLDPQLEEQPLWMHYFVASSRGLCCLLIAKHSSYIHGIIVSFSCIQGFIQLPIFMHGTHVHASSLWSHFPKS